MRPNFFPVHKNQRCLYTHKKKIMTVYHKTKWIEIFVVKIIDEEQILLSMNCYNKQIRIEPRV